MQLTSGGMRSCDVIYVAAVRSSPNLRVGLNGRLGDIGVRAGRRFTPGSKPGGAQYANFTIFHSSKGLYHTVQHVSVIFVVSLRRWSGRLFFLFFVLVEIQHGVREYSGNVTQHVQPPSAFMIAT